MTWHDFIHIPGTSGKITDSMSTDPQVFEIFEGIGGASLDVDGGGGLSFGLPEGWDFIVEAIDAAWETFWAWVEAAATAVNGDDGTRHMNRALVPAVVVAALPAIRTKLVLVKTVAAVLLPVLAKVPGTIAKVGTFVLTLQKYSIMYQIVDKLLDLWQNSGSGGQSGDLTPLLEKLEDLRATLEAALIVEPDGQVKQSIFERAFLFDGDEGYDAILKKAFLFDGAEGGANNAAILEKALLFTDPQDLYKKGVFERGLLKQVEEMDGDTVVTVVKSLLELLQLNVQDLSYIDAKLILGNFALSVFNAKYIEHL